MTESNQPAQQPDQPDSVPSSAGQTDSGAREQGPSLPEPGQPDPLQGGSGQAGATAQTGTTGQAGSTGYASPSGQPAAPAGLGDVPASFTSAQPQVPSPDAGQTQLGGSGPGQQLSSPSGSGQPHPLGLGATTAQFGAESPFGGQQPAGPPSNPFAAPQQGSQTGQYYLPPGYQPPVEPRPKGRGKVVAGVAALVLLVGGLSGGLGGYLGYNFANDSSSVSSLDSPRPASQTSNAPAGSVEDVANKLLPSVVQIQVTTRAGAGEGSGFIISGNGQIVTNNHVIEGAAAGGDIKVVFQDGRTASAKILGRDPSSDIAVIQADGVSNLPVVQLGNSGDMKIGQGVVAIGSPFELSGTVTSGIVSSLNRPVSAGGDRGSNSQATVLNAIQTDAAINPGNSGGPLVNMQGQVVGINSAIYSPSQGQGQAGSVGIGFAIPMDQARRTIDEIVKSGKPKQTVLGVKVESTEQGARITEITAGGAAEKAGLKAGDVITKFGDRRIDESDTLVAAVRSKAPGDKVTITLSDNRTVEATLDGVEVG
ncbi:trypsin-like peptidase domain-containing protein [Lentzea sp. HUAS12]|uniref:trypsin-like peptidase domain-containing protein n=1 Tax=Lentzea sp. HUAS12 TaxID=2951806 RepID=UPI0020A19129|nr:trypsin-like peptidase domain-containing protein [Lentzea sp. HUAS12]USX49433.1 trypsin-like peptidase domain-containing protein [Lentzea sp. HUAS12]